MKMIGYVTLSMVLTTKTSMHSGTSFVMSMKSLSLKDILVKDFFQKANVSVVVECLWTKLDE
jgi:hypothetical protein